MTINKLFTTYHHTNQHPPLNSQQQITNSHIFLARPSAKVELLFAHGEKEKQTQTSSYFDVTSICVTIRGGLTGVYAQRVECRLYRGDNTVRICHDRGRERMRCL